MICFKCVWNFFRSSLHNFHPMQTLVYLTRSVSVLYGNDRFLDVWHTFGLTLHFKCTAWLISVTLCIWFPFWWHSTGNGYDWITCSYHIIQLFCIGQRKPIYNNLMFALGKQQSSIQIDQNVYNQSVNILIISICHSLVLNKLIRKKGILSSYGWIFSKKANMIMLRIFCCLGVRTQMIDSKTGITMSL